MPLIKMDLRGKGRHPVLCGNQTLDKGQLSFLGRLSISCCPFTEGREATRGFSYFYSHGQKYPERIGSIKVSRAKRSVERGANPEGTNYLVLWLLVSAGQDTFLIIGAQHRRAARRL